MNTGHPGTGHQRSPLVIPKLDLYLNGTETHLELARAFCATVEFYYEAEIKPTEDEPGCEEFVEIERLIVDDAAFFHSEDAKMYASLNRGTNLLSMLSESQYYDMIELIKKQIKGDYT